MHLTLRFLGDTPENKLSEISAELDAITSHFQPFTLQLAQLGSYPNKIRPRVIWAGLSGETTTLKALQSQIATAIHRLGWQKENRPFRPHLTLGRIKDKSQAHRLTWNIPLENKAFTISAINLIESQLRPTGPIYTIQHSSFLVGSEQ